MDYQNNFKQFLTRSSQSEKENLTQKEMDELEEVINISKESASREEAHRQAAEVSKVFYKTASPSTSGIGDNAVKQKPFTPKSWSKPPKSPVNVSAVNQDLFSSQEFKITFHNLSEPSGILLDIIYHEPNYERPVPVDCKRYNTQQKAKMLSEHLTKTNQLKARLARESLRKIPYPKPILPSNKCTTFLLKNGGNGKNGNLDDTFVDQIPIEDLYLSRAGRQIKRKTYTEDTDGDSDPDFTISNKKNKIDDSDLKITLDNPYIPEENHSEAKVESKVTKTRKDTPRRGALSLKKTPMTRSERVYDKLVQDDIKKKQADEERKNLEKTLPSLEESEDEWIFQAAPPVEESTTGNDEDFMPRRIVPPIPASKNRLKTKKSAKVEDLDKIETVPEGPSRSPVLKRGTASKTADKPKRKPKTQKPTENQGPKEKLEKTPCPICNREFLQSEIQNHASSCGIDEVDFIEEPQESKRMGTKLIKCELCDKYFAMNTDYEVHVKYCMAEQVQDL